MNISSVLDQWRRAGCCVLFGIQVRVISKIRFEQTHAFYHFPSVVYSLNHTLLLEPYQIDRLSFSISKDSWERSVAGRPRRRFWDSIQEIDFSSPKRLFPKTKQHSRILKKWQTSLCLRRATDTRIYRQIPLDSQLMSSSNLVLASMIYSGSCHGAHAHDREPPL